MEQTVCRMESGIRATGATACLWNLSSYPFLDLGLVQMRNMSYIKIKYQIDFLYKQKHRRSGVFVKYHSSSMRT
jgi:hypothetical protein